MKISASDLRLLDIRRAKVDKFFVGNDLELQTVSPFGVGKDAAGHRLSNTPHGGNCAVLGRTKRELLEWTRLRLERCLLYPRKIKRLCALPSTVSCGDMRRLCVKLMIWDT
eukprot:6189289-Pleurochrysis_carterae.AAC.3